MFGIVPDCDLGNPSAIHNFAVLKAIHWVSPPYEDGFSIEGDLAAVFVEKDFTPSVT
jgi:hypothetical protein